MLTLENICCICIKEMVHGEENERDWDGNRKGSTNLTQNQNEGPLILSHPTLRRTCNSNLTCCKVKQSDWFPTSTSFSFHFIYKLTN